MWKGNVAALSVIVKQMINADAPVPTSAGGGGASAGRAARPPRRGRCGRGRRLRSSRCRQPVCKQEEESL